MSRFRIIVLSWTICILGGSAKGLAADVSTPIEFVRTPESRFANLPDYPFKPHYSEFRGLRMHYLDEGPRDGTVVLMLHGEPSWSFLYRKMIPLVASAGYRVIAPDLFGFGKSDKPTNPKDYSYQFHIDSIEALLKTLDLNNITLVCQDWGGLIGLRVVADEPARFSAIVAANTALTGAPVVAPPTAPRPKGMGFAEWFMYAQRNPDLPIGEIIEMGTATTLSPEIRAAYEAPFPDERYKVGAKEFPKLVFTQLKKNRAAWDVLKTWDKPFLTAYSDGDPITFGQELAFQENVPGARQQSHITIKGAGHFLQEDKGEELARVVIDFLNRSREK